MKIAKNTIVSIDYTLRDDDGEIVDSSEGQEPLAYLHGHGQIVPGLERALDGKAVGDALKVDVSPEDGYGELEEARVIEIDRKNLPEDMPLELGMPLTAESDDGHQMQVYITAIEGDVVRLDGNHPLAGKTLHFDVKVTAVRAATKEELTHGHAHGPGGAH